MKIKYIKVNHLKENKQFYDVINANPYNNFLIKTNDGAVCSHNCFFDEISFIKNQDIDKQKARAIDMIDTAIGGMKTRFIQKGIDPTLLILASSKRSEKSFLEEHIRQKLESEPDNVIIVDKPVWDVKPKGTYSDETFKVALGNKYLESLVLPDGLKTFDDYILKGYKLLDVPVNFKAIFKEDIERALCDYAGISSSELSKYISGKSVTDNIIANKQNPFSSDVLEIGNAPDDTRQYFNFFDITKIPEELRYKPLCVHLDMSISGDMTGIAGTFIKGKKITTEGNQSKDLLYSLGFSVSIKAPKGRQISFEKNRNFIRWLKEQGLNIKEVSYDTFQSYDTGQQLQAEGFNCSILSVDRVDTDHICLTGDTEIQTLNGNKNIVDIVPGDIVKSFNVNTKEFEYKEVVSWNRNNSEKIYSIQCGDKVISCTGNHLVLTLRGYVRADELSVNDIILGE